MERWNKKKFETMILESNKIRNVSLYEVLQRAYIEQYKDLHVFCGIDPSGLFCSFSPVLSEEESNLSLSDQAKKIERSGQAPTFEVFKRTAKRQLSTILDTMLNQTDALGIFRQGTSYQFSEAQSATIQSLLLLWTTETDNVANFLDQKYSEVDLDFLLALQNAMRYLLMGCFEDRANLNELQTIWAQKFMLVSSPPQNQRQRIEEAYEQLLDEYKALRGMLDIFYRFVPKARVLKSEVYEQFTAEEIQAALREENASITEEQIKFLNDCQAAIHELREKLSETVYGINSMSEAFNAETREAISEKVQHKGRKNGQT